MVFRIITALCLLVLVYAGFEWGRMAWLAHRAYEPKAEFLADGPKDDNLYLIEYLDYRCSNCTQVYRSVKELRAQHPYIRYVARPLVAIDDQSEKLARLALAAGLEGKFWEFHDALRERRGDAPEAFLRETANLYGLDYDALVKRGESAEVTAILDDNDRAAALSNVLVVPSFVVGRTYHEVPNPLENTTVATFMPWVAQEEQTR